MSWISSALAELLDLVGEALAWPSDQLADLAASWQSRELLALGLALRLPSLALHLVALKVRPSRW